jgi:hypothetical protein
MSKRLFQVLDEMNQNDDVNKTATCGCCFDMVAANKVKQGGHVTMGVPTEAVIKILIGEYKPMLVLLDMKVYNQIEKQPVEDKLAAAEHQLHQMAKAVNELIGIAYPNVPVLKNANQALTDYQTYKQGKDEH